jgi:ring-1,2-phenylacetyl-CoA epoxidase subunit PaaD
VTTAAGPHDCRSASVDRSADAWAAAAAVPDPEIPVLTIADLGILRAVEVDEDGRVLVTVTPTYSGCPAMDAIRADVVTALRAAGFDGVDVHLVLSPTWTTEWMSEEGRRKLVDHGIAPPGPGSDAEGHVRLTLTVRCPRCGSADTREISRFGSTACKSLWSCRSCREPFDHFKSI